MVNDRSDFLRSRTGIHGGLRRGSAAAAIGAVLVLTAGVPASQADAVADSGDPEVQVTGAVQLPEIGGLLQGLLGTSGTATSPAQPTPVPEATSASPSPAPTTAPTGLSPAPTTSSSSGAAAIPQQAVTGASAPSQQQPGTAGGQPGPLPAGQGSAPQAAEAPATAQDAAGQPVSGAESPAAVPSSAGAPSPAASRGSGSGTLQAAGGPARGRAEMGPARAADPAGEAAKVWVGVGLVGSAGAAGLVLTRIRRF
jgi:hypothetical protein